MAKTTIKELEARINGMEEKMNSIDENIKSILATLNATSSEAKSSAKKDSKKDSKKSTKASPSATKCTVTIEDGQGRGQGKKFIKIIFDGKPTDKTLKSLKDKGFTYFAPHKSWSSLHTDAKFEFAQSLIK